MPNRGVVKDNVVVLEDKAGLVDGMEVIVIPVREVEKQPDFSTDPFLNVDEWAPFPPADAPKDLAQRHDYYLYGEKSSGA